MPDKPSSGPQSGNGINRPTSSYFRAATVGGPEPINGSKHEPELILLLGTPEVRLLMQADRINEQELLAMLDAIAIELRKNSDPTEDDLEIASDRRPDDRLYRPGVGIILLNRLGEVLVGRRNDLLEEAWQLPQGGIDNGETPQEAALRELREEIGTDDVDVVAESKSWLYYDVPDELAAKAWRGRWKGQRQKWFVMTFKGWDADINIETEKAEFNAWKWISVHELTDIAVAFKRKVYADIIGEFATIFRD